MLEFKNGDRRYLGYSFSEILANKYRDIDKKFDLIIPIPINEKRLKTRGFNQSEILCRALTDTGKVNVPRTIAGGRCELETDTGDIEISISK